MADARQQEYILKSHSPQLLKELLRTIAYENAASFDKLLELAFVYGNLPAVLALVTEAAETRPDRFNAQRNLRYKLCRHIRYHLAKFSPQDAPQLLSLVSGPAQTALFQDLLQSSPALTGDRLFALLDSGCVAIGNDCVLSAARRLYSCQGSVAMEAMRALVQRGYPVNVKPEPVAFNLDFLGPEDDPVMEHPCSDGTPLHCAALYAIGVDFLLQHGADCTATDANGNTPLVYAATEGHCEAIRALVLHCPQAINIVNTAHQSPLSILADKSHADCVRLLLSNGADPLPVMPSIVSTAVAFLRGDIGGPKADPFGTMEALLGYNCLHHPKDFSLAAYFPPDRINLPDLICLAASGARASELLVAPAPTSSLCGSLSSLALAKLRILYLVFIIMFKLPSGPAWIAAIKRAILSTATDAQDQSELPESAIEAGRTLTEWLSQPPSLLLSTALKVHSLLGPANYSAKIDRLPLPSALKRQLFLVDVRPV
ncbi:hypothetical protein BOX15_Mlig028768g1 [Macrostomum lignano]|uniref:Uncharacterized protein n=1 Tax=Macrostomum lignano TaxID=282301 RepID=A0A267DZX9_9PLAT|nr:hypothetical protein BOX15_Mlig028768g1 [Macrostomum lignano]